MASLITSPQPAAHTGSAGNRDSLDDVPWKPDHPEPAPGLATDPDAAPDSETPKDALSAGEAGHHAASPSPEEPATADLGHPPHPTETEDDSAQSARGETAHRHMLDPLRSNHCCPPNAPSPAMGEEATEAGFSRGGGDSHEDERGENSSAQPPQEGRRADLLSSPVSETTASPSSVTTPPYWSSSARQNPRLSTLSVESMLPAITLQDNEREDAEGDASGASATVSASASSPSAAATWGRDRQRACWAKNVEVVDPVLVNGSTTNFGAFIVWNIRVQTLNGSYMNIRKRYSDFDELRQRLIQTFPSFEAAVPDLPPKSIMLKFLPRFLEKRRIGLQYFLNCILLNPEFSGSPVLKDFLFS